MLTGLLPNPVWPPSGMPIPGAPVQPTVPVAKPVPAVAQPVPVSSKHACFQVVFLILLHSTALIITTIICWLP